LTWSDPDNDPSQVEGYHLYYWQATEPMPARVDVGEQTTYTLTGLAAGQTYNFAVTAYNSLGESADSNVVSTTFPADAPVAHFSATPSTIPLTVTLTSTSTGTITSWAWTFGDGGTSTAANPQHTYTAVGTYTVQLRVTGPSGVDTATAPVTVSPIPGASLVAAYSFDEGSGPTVTDVSGQGNHGTISGATWTTAGKFGGALVFDGTRAVVTVPDAAALRLTTALTLEAWVSPSVVTSAWRDVIYKGNDTYALEATSGNSSVPAGGSTFGGRWVAAYGPTALRVNRWTHLALTYDGATLRLYVNGVQVASQAQGGRLPTSTYPLQIGGDSIYGQYFQGTIDEVRIYNRALSAPEIQADMQTPINVLNSLIPLQ